MEVLVICISVFIIICALATCGGVFYAFKYDDQRRSARLKPVEVDYDPWMKRPQFALDADVTVYWPDVRPVWEESFVMPRENPAIPNRSEALD